MAKQHSALFNRASFTFSDCFRKTIVRVLLISTLCSLFYLLGLYKRTKSVKTVFFQPPDCPKTNASISKNSITDLNSIIDLDFETHHGDSSLAPTISLDSQEFEYCEKNFTDYCPCQDHNREKRFSANRLFFRERHCPEREEVLRCLIPRPARYRTPFPWPKSRDLAWFDNVPYKTLSVSKASQNWVRVQGRQLVFPGGGTSFPAGAKPYIQEIGRVVPLKNGDVRTVLDVGCGVASFGAYLLDYNILTMSIAPNDVHQAQVQFALERGVPAMLEILSTYRLPYPSRSFDMAHCSRCLVQWTGYGGLYLLEIDRILRPGGYWVLSGPPINWKNNYKGWQRDPQQLSKEQDDIENLARLMCWKKVSERDNIAVWRKPTNHVHCTQKLKIWNSLRFCEATDPDFAWYKEMDLCITPLPKVETVKEIAGGALEKWPKRLFAIPPRIISGEISGITAKIFNQDNQLWKQRVSHYGHFLSLFAVGKYRNIIDMNSELGGFAAALSKYPVWVMNVVPSNNNTLGIINERGLLGTYMDWCEAFSTYPRTYDLIHANGILSMYMNKCDVVDILLEMYRILRPEGAIIIRDHVDLVTKAKTIADRMRWHSQIAHSERGPFNPEKLLIVDNSVTLHNQKKGSRK